MAEDGFFRRLRRNRPNERTRKLVREVGSIVLGVLIALAIGEAADAVRHRINARGAMTAVRAEMGVTGNALEERMMARRCTARRLDQLRDELAAARRTGRLRDLGDIGRPAIRPFGSTAWSTLVESGEVLFLPRDDLELARSYFSGGETYLRTQQDEQVAWARLRVLIHRPGRLDDNLMAEMELTVEEAAFHAKLLAIIARQMWNRQRLLGVATDYDFYNDGGRSAMVAQARSNPLCRPL